MVVTVSMTWICKAEELEQQKEIETLQAKDGEFQRMLLSFRFFAVAHNFVDQQLQVSLNDPWRSMRLLDAQLFPLLEALELSKVCNVLADDIRFLKLKLINIFLNLSFTTYFPFPRKSNLE